MASAAKISRDNLRIPRSRTASDWQAQAWYFHDTIGELRFAAHWLGNALSQVRLTVEIESPEGEPEAIAEGAPVEALDALFHGETGQSQMMNTFGVHLTVPGETYLLGIAGTDDATAAAGTGEASPGSGGDQWLVLSNDEVKITRAGKVTYDRGDGKKRALTDDDLLIRIWRGHPRISIEADSPTRAVLPILREIEALTKHVGATVDSRLAGAGLLLLPSEMTFGTPTPDTDPQDPQSDPFLLALTEAMVTPIGDRGSAAAVVPIVVRAPGAVLANAQHITFSTDLDAQARELRTEAIRRLALGMDLPPEVLLGQADSNHWSAWQIEESALKVHIEPVCELICDALTRMYLRPVLNLPDDSPIHVGFDTSALRLRPNHSAEAVQLYDRLELSGSALRRETGFEESDEPQEDDIKSAVLRKIATGISDADLTAAAIAALGITLIPQASAVADLPGGATSAPGQPPQPVVEPSPQERRNLPEAAAGLTLACQLVLHRAVERAWNRLGRRGATRRPCDDSDKRVEALRGCFETVPAVASLYGLDPARLSSVLCAYADRILTTGSGDADAFGLLGNTCSLLLIEANLGHPIG